MNHLLFALLVFSQLSYAQKTPTLVIDADHALLAYEGRIDRSEPGQASFCYPGTSVAMAFQGTAAELVLEDFGTGDEQHTNYYTVELDGKEYSTLAARPGKHTYTLVKNLPSARHQVKIFKRTECSVGKSTFWGFKVPQGTILEQVTLPQHRIEFIGDSFTCGYGNEASIPGPPEGNPNTGFHSKNENHYISYSAILARQMQLSYCCVAYSGRGMYRNNTGSEEGTLPKIYTRIFPDEASGPLWEVKKEVPEVIVIKLGANDFFPESRGEELNDSLFTRCYVDFLKQLRAYYPQAKIVCLTGVSMSDHWPEGRNCLTRIKQDVQGAVAERTRGGDDQVYYFNLDPQTSPYGEDWHASAATHRKVAEQLIPYLRDISGWK